MEIRHLFYLSSIRKFGTMTKAAEELHVSQSALSLSCKHLEEELGVTLFEKKGRTLTFTEAGEYFCREAARILQQVKKLEDDMRKYNSQQKYTLTTYSDAVEITSETAFIYTGLFPDFQLLPHHCAPEEILDDLKSGTVDFSLTLSEYNDGGMVSEPLIDEPMLVLVSRESELAKLESISVSQLRGLPLITMREGMPYCTLIESFYARAWVVPGNRITISDMEGSFLHVSMGRGISFIPESSYNQHMGIQVLTNDRFVGLPLKEEYCRRRVYLTYDAGRQRTEICRAFMDFLHLYTKKAQEEHCLPAPSEFMAGENFKVILKTECST